MYLCNPTYMRLTHVVWQNLRLCSEMTFSKYIDTRPNARQGSLREAGPHGILPRKDKPYVKSSSIEKKLEKPTDIHEPNASLT